MSTFVRHGIPMNEGEHSPAAHFDGQSNSPSQPIAERVRRRFLFNRHVTSCPTCGNDASDLCDYGHRLLREAIDS